MKTCFFVKFPSVCVSVFMSELLTEVVCLAEVEECFVVEEEEVLASVHRLLLALFF